jgi:hypothetical protein
LGGGAFLSGPGIAVWPLDMVMIAVILRWVGASSNQFKDAIRRFRP